jgi:hypothetical protein
MTAATSTEIEIQGFRRANRTYAFIATFMFGGVILFVIMLLGVIVLRGQAMGATRVTRIVLSWSPAIGYLWALWTLRGVFLALARDGLSFQPAVIRALRHLGAALGIGAALSMIEGGAVYFLTRAWRTGGVVPGDANPITGVNVPAMTLVLTSVALTLLAQMLARGARLEAETTRLKAALDDFI